MRMFLWILSRSSIKRRHRDETHVLYKDKRVASPLHEEAAEMIMEMLDMGLIGKAEGYSAWCSPFPFVPKPTGGLRLITCMRYLNKKDQQTHTSIPNNNPNTESNPS